MKNTRIFYNKITDVAYINNNNFIRETSNQLRNYKNSKFRENSVFINGTHNFIKRLRGPVFSFLYSVSAKDNYWHWIFDVLPKIAILKKKFNLKQIEYFLFPEISNRFQIESLNVLKIPLKKRVSGHKYNHIFSEKIISCDHPFIFNDMLKDQKKITEWIGRWYKEIIVQSRIKKKKKSNKIYIDRSDSKNTLRKIVNEEELKKYLKSKSFKIVKLSQMSFLDQIRTFYNSNCVLGLHGAGFANIVFCRPKTKIIEIGTTHKSKNIIFSLAKSNKLKYRCIFFDSVKNHSQFLLSSRHQDQHIKVDINKLKKII